MGLWDTIKEKVEDALEGDPVEYPEECEEECRAVFDTLRRLDTDGGFAGERELQEHILRVLEENFPGRDPQSEVITEWGRVDITLGDDVAIELKVRHGKAAIDRAIAQVNGYAERWFVFLFIYVDKPRLRRKVAKRLLGRLEEDVVAIIADDEEMDVVTWQDAAGGDDDEDY